MALAFVKTNKICSDSLFYFLPKTLIMEQVFPVTTLSIKKKYADFEIDMFNLSENQTPSCLSTCLENRFSFYDVFLFEKQEFLFSFQSFDLASGVRFFSKKRKRVQDKCGLFSVLKEKHSFFTNRRGGSLIKARLLYLVKGGFVLSCFGNPAILIKDSPSSDVQTQRTYRGWFSSNFVIYGHLSYFKVFSFQKFSLPYFSGSQKMFSMNKLRFYDIKNSLLGYLFVLGKPKRIYY